MEVVNLPFQTHHFLFLLSCGKKRKETSLKSVTKEINTEQVKDLLCVKVKAVCKYPRDQPAELGLGLNVPDTISPRLEEEFPLDLLLRHKKKMKSLFNVGL